MAAAREDGEVRAIAKWVRTSPRKARLVAEHIRGRTVPEARTVLAFTPRAAAREIEKVLRSAVANAEANHGLVGDNLYVSAAYVDDGVTMKRIRARARGRVARIQKRTCHITVRLAPAEQAARADGKARTPMRERSQIVPATTEGPSSEEKATARRGRDTEPQQEAEA